MKQNNIEMISERILNRIERGRTLQEEQREVFWEYALNQGMRMTNEEYEQLSEKSAIAIKKSKYIL